MRTIATIAGFAAALTDVAVRGGHVALWQVDDLERHVDRRALLAGDEAPEPPYWAHLWSGARVLADAVPRARSAVEIGCGLGLPGLAAARLGAAVTFVDRVPAALAFVAASARANGVGARLVASDATAGAVRGRFGLVLAAEVLYDRATFPALARAIAALLAPGGRALITDARRIDTSAFYPELDAAGLAWEASEQVVDEEGFPVRVRLVEARHALPGAEAAG